MEQKEQREADDKFYQEIWNNRPHRCAVCDTYLPEPINRCYFEHLLEKALERYKHLRYEPDNLILICIDDHAKKTNGFPLPKHQELIEQAKKRFNI